MGVLVGIAAAAGLALAACYSPSLRDCTVSCGSASDCASGQVCGADGMCASPAVAGRCRTLVDAGNPDGPSPPHPDAALPDAARTIRLTVQIMGKGSVVVEGVGACSSQDPDKGNCMYDVVPGAPLAAQANPITPTDVFAAWSSVTCAGQGARCQFTPVMPTMIAARFGHSDMHDAL
ncbi:MAG TPA: hypothetical protein VHT91_41660 [Kofleriaceae bacterium]|jgi:hypothetical protein|nr:hypothetical protein [Kofleriaceae bacterium]